MHILPSLHILRFHTDSAEKGFTLQEILISMVIIATLSVISFSTFHTSQVKARDQKRKTDLHSIQTALELFYQQYKRYPCTSNTTWETSTSTHWLYDDHTITCTGNSGSDIILDPTFLSAMPTDPSGDDSTTPYVATKHGYGYWSGDASSPTCAKHGVYYVLVTQLENDNDSDTLGKAHYKWCDGTTQFSSASSIGAFGDDSYILTSP